MEKDVQLHGSSADVELTVPQFQFKTKIVGELERHRKRCARTPPEGRGRIKGKEDSLCLYRTTSFPRTEKKIKRKKKKRLNARGIMSGPRRAFPEADRKVWFNGSRKTTLVGLGSTQKVVLQGVWK